MPVDISLPKVEKGLSRTPFSHGKQGYRYGEYRKRKLLFNTVSKKAKFRPKPTSDDLKGSLSSKFMELCAASKATKHEVEVVKPRKTAGVMNTYDYRTSPRFEVDMFGSCRKGRVGEDAQWNR